MTDGITIDSTTGQITEPLTEQDCIIDQFSRYAREAGVRLRDLFREMERLPMLGWTELSDRKRSGILDDWEQAKKEGWNKTNWQKHQRLYTVVMEIRRILKLATMPTLTDKQVNREATGGKSQMPSWVLPPDTPPAWVSFLESQHPGIVSSTGSIPFGQRFVQIRLTEWPTCLTCENLAIVTPEGGWCEFCSEPVEPSNRVYDIWDHRIADEYGMYPEEWTIGQPSAQWAQAIPERMMIYGLEVTVWEITAEMEELESAETDD